VNVPRRRVAELLLVGDSLLGGMAGFGQDQLQAIAYERGWELRCQKGGLMRQVRRLVEEAQEELSSFQFIVVGGGSNDMADAYALGHSVEDCVNIVKKDLQKALEVVTKTTSVPVVFLPPHRRDVSPDFRNEVVESLKGWISDKIVPTFDPVKDVSWKDTFVSEGLEDDGIHITKKGMRRILEKLVTMLDLPELLNVEPITSSRFFPDQCWKCGRKKHAAAGMCDYHGVCDRCGRQEHHEDVCLHKYLMCFHCGRRGHAKARCPERSNN